MSVYFAQRDGLIKIGWSTNVHSRISTLRAKLIGAIPGDKKTENVLHKRFARFRVHGEWFKADKSLLAYIRDEAQSHAPDLTHMQTPIRLPYEILERVDKIAERMSPPGMRVTRSEVIRYFVAEGVEREEKKNGCE
jgi:hypothetical protein